MAQFCGGVLTPLRTFPNRSHFGLSFWENFSSRPPSTAEIEVTEGMVPGTYYVDNLMSKRKLWNVLKVHAKDTSVGAGTWQLVTYSRVVAYRRGMRRFRV